MASAKRTSEGKENAIAVSASSSPFMPMFEGFRNELDEHHDRRERIIKASRDITALSKKMIFSLQRVRSLKDPIPSSLVTENSPRQKTITNLFASIAPDLSGINSWRYQRQISNGIQEFMEAISFQYYLETQSLITFEGAKKKLPSGVLLAEDDYILGVFDLVGELMRFAITSMATNGKVPGSTVGDLNMDNIASEPGHHDMVVDLRLLRSCLEAMNIKGSSLDGDVSKKMEVVKTCVEKVEMAVYGMIVRGMERPEGWMPDPGEDDRGAEIVEMY